MKFLNKMGSRKFWALIAAVVTSCMVMFGYSQDQTMKVVALITNVGAVVVYLLVEGSIDKAGQQQQVYVVPGSGSPAPDSALPTATVPTVVSQPAASPLAANPPPLLPSSITYDDVIARVREANDQLNKYMDQINQGKMTDANKDAISKYLQIHAFVTGGSTSTSSAAADTANKPASQPTTAPATATGGGSANASA